MTEREPLRVLAQTNLMEMPPRTRQRRHVVAIDTTPVACRGEALHEIWWRGRQWAVTSYGVECLDGTYSFETKRLADGLHGSGPVDASWCVQMAEKGWVNVDDFATAWLVALSLHGVRVPPRKVRRMITHLPVNEPPQPRGL
jgi:hypothetical protein